jgi:hypothetical protein
MFKHPPKVLVVLSVVVAVVAATLTGSALAQSTPSPARAVVEPVAAGSFHGYRVKGPSAKYGSDFGLIGQMHPVRVSIGGTSDMVVSVSFTYRTSRDRFVSTLGVQGPNDRWKDVLPAQRILRPAPNGASTTLQFVVEDLKPGIYRVSLGVNVDRFRGPARVTTRQVLISGQVTPAATT